MEKALCIPPVAVLSGLLILTSYVISPAVIIVPDTNWREAALIWLSINMPTGSTKSSLCHHLDCVLQQIRRKSGCSASHPAWLLGDATCEKMAENGGRLSGLYDELTFLTQLNLHRGTQLQNSWFTGIYVFVSFTCTSIVSGSLQEVL